VNVDGVAKHGWTQPEFLQYITLLNSWFNEGLIDPDFDTMDGLEKDARFASGRSAAKIDAYGDAGIWVQSGQVNNPEFAIAATPYPVLNKGDSPSTLKLRQENYRVRGQPSYVSTDCEYPEYAIRFIDYAYTVDGFLMLNYGVEGESWVWEAGEPADDEIGYFPPELKGTGQHPAFTELMTNNPDGHEFWTILYKYKPHNHTGLRSPMAYLIGQDARDAMEIWSVAGTDYFWPQTALTTEEANRQSELRTDIDAYRDQMLINMIKGVEPLSSWETYLSTMESMGVPEWEAIRQASLDRYAQR
jgi:putative aldouronate transport system substrate-binding protein